MKKIILILLSIFFITAIGLYFYTYQNHRNISTEKAAFTLTLSKLQSEFAKNDSLFNAKYADKTIEIYGKVTSVDLQNQSLMLDDKIVIGFENPISIAIKISDTTHIKGRYVGYDDLLDEFKIDQAIIVKK